MPTPDAAIDLAVMQAIRSDELSAVFGGTTTTAADGTTTTETTPYETCRQTMDQAAREKYPDNRWFFQRWMGAKDDNADARKKWLDESLPGTCGPAPKS